MIFIDGEATGQQSKGQRWALKWRQQSPITLFYDRLTWNLAA